MGDKNLAQQAIELKQAWVALRNSPSAYRPDGYGAPDDEDRRVNRSDSAFLLDDLANLGNALGMTAGDTAVVAVEMVRLIDEYRDYDEAMAEIVRRYRVGELRAVTGVPLSQLTPEVSVKKIAMAVAFDARNQAFHESTD